MNTFLKKGVRVAGWATLLGVAGAQTAQAADGWDVSSYNARNGALKQDYFSMHDDYDIWVNPAWLGHYANRFYGSLTVADQQSTVDDSRAQLAGGQIEIGPVTAGVYMGRPYSGPLQDYWISPGLIPTPGNLLTPPIGSSAVKNLFDAFASMSLGVVDAGVRLNINRYADQKLNPVGTRSSGVTVVSDEQKLSANDVNLVFGVVSKQYPAELALTIGRPTLDNTFSYSETGTGVTSEESGGAKVRDSELALAARADVFSFGKGLMRLSARLEKYTLTVEQTNRVEAGGVTTTDLSGRLDSKRFAFSAFGTFVLKPADKVTLIASGGAHYYHATGAQNSYDNLNATPLQMAYSGSMYHVDFPARLGVEVTATDRWTLRAGASRVVYRVDRYSGGLTVANGVTQELSVPREQISDADPLVELALGARFTLGDSLMLDGTINKDIFQTGTYLLSGVSDRLLTQLSLIYKF